uniref:BED-type domain-containing protein n=1 Tax=Solanum lycopersicum TaxID=4081 RepID=A0A3Q7I4T0_SOLLC
MAYLFAVFGESIMAENVITDKVVGESGASNSNAIDQSQIVESQVKKGRKKRSRAWDHFSRKTDSDGNEKGVCNYCKKEYFVDTKEHGTTSMLNHTSKCPKMPYNIDIRQSRLAFQPMIGGNKGDVVVVPWKFDQEECRKALCRMVIIDELPFRFVEKEGFKQLMKVAQPCFHIPSRTTVTCDCFNLFDEEKHKLMVIFKGREQRVSLTTDTWTSIQRINYMVITSHWIDKNWTLHKRIINFCPITSHRGEDLEKSISKCLNEWGLHHIFTVTVDNAGSNSVGITELSKQLTKWGTNLMGGSHLHISCMAHIVNLIVQDGTKEANVSIERVRQAVRYIRQSPARWKKFQEYCEDENLAKKSLCSDVPTRWNSTYMMLKRVIEYEGTLLSSYWEGVKRITKFLDFNLTLKISGSRYVISNLHFLEICQVGVYLNQLISNEDHVLAKMAENMKEKFDKYWGDTEKMNKMVFIPCVLDPRHKFITLGFALRKMFGEKGAAFEIGVRTYMESLFNEYIKPVDSDKNGQFSSTEVDTSDSRSVDSRSGGEFGNFFEELQKHTSEKGGASSKSELVKYLDEEIEVGKSDFDVIALVES